MGRGRSGAGKTELNYGGQSGYISQSNVDKLIDMGAQRWEKYGKDRLYIGQAGEKILNLDIERYKSGSISSATIDGQKISNSDAARYIMSFSEAYIDLNTGKLEGSKGRYSDEFIKKMDKYIKKNRKR